MIEAPARSSVDALMPSEFDPDAVEALGWREVEVEVIVAADDPLPNRLKLVQLRTSLGNWEARFDRSGLWHVDGAPLGPTLQADLARMQRQADMGVVDYGATQSA